MFYIIYEFKRVAVINLYNLIYDDFTVSFFAIPASLRPCIVNFTPFVLTFDL